MTNTTDAPTMTPATAALVEAVKAHAAENYLNGWDVVIETMDDDDIAERIGRARTEKSAIARVGQIVAVQVERRIEVLSQSGEHDAEVAELVGAAKKGRGRSKTGHPRADRAISDAKVEKAREQATADAAPAVPTVSVKEWVELAHDETVSAETVTADETPVKKTRAAKAWAPITLPTGYAVRWDNGAYDLAKKGEGAEAEAATWLVICKTHSTTTTADNVKDADVLGRRAGRATWCTGCKS